MHRRTFLQSGAAVGMLGLVPGARVRSLPRVARSAEPGEIRLSSNENPLGISPAARDAIIRGLPQANRYPGHSRAPLVEALAKHHGVPPNRVVLGNGSTEVLQMAVQAFAAPGTRFIVADPTFEDVPRYVEPFAVELVKVALTPDGGHDLTGMRAEARRSRGPALIYVCNPNNPTGTVTPTADVEAWIADAPPETVFLVDEAYVDYVDDARYRSALPLIERHPNVIVVRTFSKVYGMAGLRLGYALAHPETAARLGAYIAANNANHVACVAGLASLGDTDFVKRSLATNAEGRRMLYACLRELEIEHFPSHTNFVMHRIRGDLETYIDRMREHGIRVGRPFPPYVEYNRVSVGLPAEMERFTGVLREFRARGWI